VWNVQKKTDTSSDRDNWNHLKIIQKISNKRAWKAEHHGTTENGHIGHCPRTSGSTNVKVQGVCYGKQQYMYPTL
jgi:hypothetical protein